MTRRNVFQHGVRIGLGVLAGVLPLLWPLLLPLTVVAMCSVLAYDGLDGRVVVWCTALLVAVELIAGIELGMFSLAFLLTVLVLAVCSRMFSLTPWAGSDGWHPGDFVRTVLLATALTAVMSAGSVLVGTFMYHFGMTLNRLRLVLSPSLLVTVAITASVAVAVLRRIDIPFRRSIRFGT